jgi:hypothetical protein
MIIGFSSTDMIFSRIIKWVTRSKASHSYVLILVEGELVVIHSNQHGVNCDYYERFKRTKQIVAEYQLLISEDKEQLAAATALKLLDKPYDFLSVFGFAWVLINRFFGRKVKNPFPNRSAYQCSEFVLEVLKSAGLEGIENLDRELVSPEDLIEFLNKCSEAKEVLCKH